MTRFDSTNSQSNNDYFLREVSCLLNIVINLNSSTMTHLKPSDRNSLNQLLSARPTWHSNETAATALNLDRSVILHAGPPFENSSQIPQPVLNSACVAAVFENLATDFGDARKKVLSNEISLQPAQNHSTVVPLAGVVSSSMWLHKVVDQSNPLNCAYSPLNGGNGPAMRLGLCTEAALAHLKWINSELVDALNECLHEELNLLPLAKEALQRGDDCHGRTIAATALLIDRFDQNINRFVREKNFLKDSPSFALNLLMAAGKCMLQAADNVPKSSVVTAAGGNGVNVGLQVAGNPGNWLILAADAPAGDLGDFPQTRALGAIGDSAVVDVCGFGAMAVSYAPAQREAFGPYLPSDADELPRQLYPSVHDEFGALQFRTGLNARTVAAEITTPIVSLGIIDRDGTAGRLGGGIYRYTIEIFHEALAAIGE